MVRNFLEPAPDLDGKSILVTGGICSFGKARTVLQRYNPAHLVIFSRDELKQHEMNPELTFPAFLFRKKDEDTEADMKQVQNNFNYSGDINVERLDQIAFNEVVA